MQADARLIKHIEHALQPRANLAGEANPLAFTTRQRARTARQSEIFEPNVVQKPESFANLLQNWPGNGQLLSTQLFWHGFAPFKGLLNRHLHHLPGVQRGNFDRQSLWAQTIPAAGAAGAIVLIPLKLFADPIAVGLAVTALHIGNDTFKAAGHLIHPPCLVIAK